MLWKNIILPIVPRAETSRYVLNVLRKDIPGESAPADQKAALTVRATIVPWP